MTTAAEALVRDCANRLDQLFRQDYTMREVEAELRRLLRAALAPPQAGEVEWIALTDEDREAAFRSMPDMLEGFLKTWGWLHFAKEIERRCMEKNVRLLRATQSNAPAPSAPAQEPVAWMLPLGEHGLIEWGQKRPDSGDINKWMPLCVCGPEYSDEFTGQIATPTKGSLLEDLRLLSNLERAHKNMSNSLFIENGQLRESLKDVLRMLEAAHRQSGIRGTDNKRIVAARSVLNAPPSLYAAPQPAQPDEAREIIAEAYTRLGIDPQFAARCEAYLARTGGKEE